MKSSDFAEPGNELAPYVNSHIVSQTLTEIFFNKNEIYYVLTGSSQVAEFLGKLAGKMFVVGGREPRVLCNSTMEAATYAGYSWKMLVLIGSNQCP